MNSINPDLLSYDYFADTYNIDMEKRYPQLNFLSFHSQNTVHLKHNVFVEDDKSNDYYKVIKRNFRNLENNLRHNIGFQNVGTYFMETLLYQRIKKKFPELTVVRQYSPKWLDNQRVDIFIVEKKLAVEFNGEQHFKPISFFGGVEGFERIKYLDKKKKRNVC